MTRTSRAATTVLAMAAAAVLAISGCSPSESSPAGDPTASVTASSSQAASPSNGATTTAIPSQAAADGWQRVLTFGDGDSFEVARELVHGDAGFLAISQGFVGGEGGPRLTGRSIWLSADGHTWDEVDFPVQGTEPWLQAMATTVDGEYVIHYSVVSDDGQHTLTEAIVSTDGRTWEALETGLPDDLGFASIDCGARGCLLVANRNDPENPGPTAWYSTDGETWELVHELKESDRWVTVIDAGAGDEGFVIAGTSTASDSSSHEYFTLASADGREWVATRSPFGVEDPTYRPDPVVASFGPAWVAALPTREGPIDAWRSENGIDWTSAGQIPFDGELTSFTPVFRDVEGLLYFSVNGGIHPGGTPGIWTSADGAIWYEVDLGADAHLGGVATGDGVNVIAATETVDEGFSVIGIWVSAAD